jgi:DNA-binding MarR family transcriptional regulator
MQNQILKSIDKTLGDAQAICSRTGYSAGALRILYTLRSYTVMRVTEIAESVGITQQAVGKTLTSLHALELLTISVDQTDARARLVRITPKGITALETISKEWR